MHDSHQPQIWTVGHSNRTAEALIDLLRAADVEQVADVRRFPGSRKHPQFGQQELGESLARQKIGYLHLPTLGGRRNKRREDSPNTGWRVEAFNAYADYMATAEFAEALATLEREAAERRTAMMCSEAVPWRCHRRLIADALTIRGWQVLDILSMTRITPHQLTPFAVVNGYALTYPAQTLF